jgi:hypothetical protein
VSFCTYFFVAFQKQQNVLLDCLDAISAGGCCVLFRVVSEVDF